MYSNLEIDTVVDELTFLRNPALIECLYLKVGPGIHKFVQG